MSSGQVHALIDRDVFERLQRLAAPLVDDINSVLRRLLLEAEAAGHVPPAPSRVAMLARGESLPVGLRLRANYHDRRVEAVVVDEGINFGGETYPSPSSAARAAKQAMGAPDDASHSNGWRFWWYIDEATGESFPLERLRRQEGEPAPGVPRLRSVGAWSSGHTDTSVLAGEVRPEPRT